MFVAVNPGLGVNTLPELIAAAKERPGKISFAVSGVGRLTHLTGELLQMRTGIQLLMVPYTAGPAIALGDVISGRVNMIIEGYSGIASAIRAGSVKPIAVASVAKLPEFPDLPMVSETVPGFAASGWQILAAPMGTPDPIIRKISADLIKVNDDPNLKQKLAAAGQLHALDVAGRGHCFRAARAADLGSGAAEDRRQRPIVIAFSDGKPAFTFPENALARQ